MPKKPPEDLDAAGRKLWRDLEAWRAGVDLEWDPHEVILLAELCRTADRLASVREAIATVDATAPPWVRLSTEERQLRLQFARTTSSLGLPSGVPSDDGKGRSPRSRRAQKAAESRWLMHEKRDAS